MRELKHVQGPVWKIISFCPFSNSPRTVKGDRILYTVDPNMFVAYESQQTVEPSLETVN